MLRAALRVALAQLKNKIFRKIIFCLAACFSGSLDTAVKAVQTSFSNSDRRSDKIILDVYGKTYTHTIIIYLDDVMETLWSW